MRVGITLPSFVDDPEVPLLVARAAEDAGLDGVFAYDHVFRGDPPDRRPALECFALLGAVAAETERIQVGSLVARATLRPAASLAAALETVHRVSGGRFVAALGSGDRESRAENESFGLGFGTVHDRIAALEAAMTAARGRGFPVWVGGRHPRLRDVAARADGWNRWGGTPTEFALEAADVRAAAPGPITVSWGGVVLVGEDERHAEVKREQFRPGTRVLVGDAGRLADQLREYLEGGPDWLILAPVDANDPDNAALLADGVAPLLGRDR